MRRFSKTAVVLAAAMLVAGLAGPAAADRPNKPGKPDKGAGLEVTVEPASTWMVANSAGDMIDFAITVTNGTENDLTGVTVEWDSEWLATFDLGANASRTLENPYEYTFSDDDLAWAIANPDADDEMLVGTVTISASELEDTTNAILTADVVEPCDVDELTGEVTLDTTTDNDYGMCSFTADPGTDWTLETIMAKKRPVRVSTVRDGIPGNWCMVPVSEEEEFVVDGKTATQALSFPAANTDGDIVCAHGGEGGESIPVRNANTFYLATWAGNTVTAEQND